MYTWPNDIGFSPTKSKHSPKANTNLCDTTTLRCVQMNTSFDNRLIKSNIIHITFRSFLPKFTIIAGNCGGWGEGDGRWVHKGRMMWKCFHCRMEYYMRFKRLIVIQLTRSNNIIYGNCDMYMAFGVWSLFVLVRTDFFPFHITLIQPSPARTNLKRSNGANSGKSFYNIIV